MGKGLYLRRSVGDCNVRVGYGLALEIKKKELKECFEKVIVPYQ